MSNSDSFYHKKQHKKWRGAVMKRAGYLCEKCKRYGRRLPNGEPVPATIAHHIKHADEYPELRYVIANGQALCGKCHNEEHPEKGGGRGTPPPLLNKESGNSPPERGTFYIREGKTAKGG